MLTVGTLLSADALPRRYWSKAVACCAQVVSIMDSGPDGGNCPAAGNCRGFNGTCADIAQQFASVPILPNYPQGLADYTCVAFPMNDELVDRRVNCPYAALVFERR